MVYSVPARLYCMLVKMPPGDEIPEWNKMKAGVRHREIQFTFD